MKLQKRHKQLLDHFRKFHASERGVLLELDRVDVKWLLEMLDDYLKLKSDQK